VRFERDSQGVIFSRPTGDSYNLFRVALLSDRKVSSDAEQITFTTGSAFAPSVSDSGRMVFSSGTVSTNLWSIPIDTDQGRVTGERQRLTQEEGVSEEYASMSGDGRKAAFRSTGKLALRVKDLGSGQETQLAFGGAPAVSPDGSFVVYHAGEGQKVSLYACSTSGGAPRRICQDCASFGPKGYSSDGSRVRPEVEAGRCVSCD
jgi:Tol biopolymer transport system component